MKNTNSSANFKIHRLLVEAVVTALHDTFSESRHADKVLEKVFKAHREWGARDRRFIAETFYECVRWWRKYWYILNEEPSTERGPLYRLWSVHWLLSGQELPSWVELSATDIKRIIATGKTKLPDDVAQSVPEWMQLRASGALGSRWAAIIGALNQKAPVDLRCNTLRGTRDDLRLKLMNEDCATEPVADVVTALTLPERKNVFALKAFKEGLFEVQDRASQRVAPFLEIEPGHRVIDTCAGAGGKSLHLAALMKNKGKLIAMDIHEWKLKELRERASRNGVDVIETRLIDSSKVIKRLANSADRVLLDVPCSGMGVLRRNPDSKWKLSNEEIDRLRDLQRELLQNYSDLTKVGGKMVYATCSILPSENEKQVEWFMSLKGQAWTLEEQLRVDPDQGRGDGFFAARFLRKS